MTTSQKFQGTWHSCAPADYWPIAGKANGFTTACIQTLTNGHWMF
jgi:hypothetical protein